MTLFDATILGAVEGITEFLPISSTGHLIIANHILGVSEDAFAKSFDIFVQMGAILAVAFLYFKKLLSSFSKIKNIAYGFIPTAIGGLLLYKIVKNYLIGNIFIVIGSLFFGGIVLLIFEKYISTHQPTKEEESPKDAMVIGAGQIVAFIPGVSRSASTIVTGMLRGLSRKSAVEFSFLLSIPTMFAASGLDIIKTNFHFSHSEIMMLMIGLVSAFVTALIAIKMFLKFVSSNTFKPFAYYRIIISIILFVIFI